MAPVLAPLPLPGLVLIPHFAAQAHEVFLVKAHDRLLGKAASVVSHVAPGDGTQVPFLQLKEEQADVVAFRTMEGDEVMRINVERHNVYRHKTEYRALRSSDAKAVWEVELKTGWRVPKYDITIHDKSLRIQEVEFKQDVAGEDKGIVINGNPAATISRHEKWKHQDAEYLVHVAPGMDMLLALGMAWIYSDKQKQDAKAGIVL